MSSCEWRSMKEGRTREWWNCVYVTFLESIYLKPYHAVRRLASDLDHHDSSIFASTRALYYTRTLRGSHMCVPISNDLSQYGLNNSAMCKHESQPSFIGRPGLHDEVASAERWNEVGTTVHNNNWPSRLAQGQICSWWQQEMCRFQNAHGCITVFSKTDMQEAFKKMDVPVLVIHGQLFFRELNAFPNLSRTASARTCLGSSGLSAAGGLDA